MKYIGIGTEMLKEIKNNDEILEYYKLQDITTLDIHCDRDLIQILFAICNIKDENDHKDEVRTSTNRINNLIDNILNIR